MPKRTYHLPVELEGCRLDQALAALVEGLSRRKGRDLIALGSVYVDGRRCRVASRALNAGAVIAVEEGPGAASSPPEVVILWQGEGIVALDKPGGSAFAPTRAAVEGTLLHALARHLGLAVNRLHQVHRLDTPTSGVVLVATTPEAAGFLGKALQEGAVRKTYLAWVLGEPAPPEGEWSLPLGGAVGGVVRVDGGGRPARTRYRVVARREERTMLELSLLTGRTHQLRVHCSAAGCPILGDRKYGGPAGHLAGRALLHAWKILFPLPAGGEQLVEAPVPPDMARDATGSETA